jgi:threonyl-tRNA synthetase
MLKKSPLHSGLAGFEWKVREHSVKKVPVIAVVGRKEAETGEVALRFLGGDGQTILNLYDAAERLHNDALPPDLREDKDPSHFSHTEEHVALEPMT